MKLVRKKAFHTHLQQSYNRPENGVFGTCAAMLLPPWVQTTGFI